MFPVLIQKEPGWRRSGGAASGWVIHIRLAKETDPGPLVMYLA